MTKYFFLCLLTLAGVENAFSQAGNARASRYVPQAIKCNGNAYKVTCEDIEVLHVKGKYEKNYSPGDQVTVVVNLEPNGESACSAEIVLLGETAQANLGPELLVSQTVDRRKPPAGSEPVFSVRFNDFDIDKGLNRAFMPIIPLVPREVIEFNIQNGAPEGVLWENNLLIKGAQGQYCDLEKIETE